jgi:uncharacterized membrane protein
MNLFGNYPQLIIFIHVISAVVWIGGMIAMRYAAHYAFQSIEDPKERLRKTANALKRLFVLVAPFTILLVATAMIMAIAMGLHHGAYKAMTMAKEGLWTVMFINYLAMVIRRNQAQRLLDNGNFDGAKAKLGLIGTYMVPLNIILGVIAIYLGVVLRLG